MFPSGMVHLYAKDATRLRVLWEFQPALLASGSPNWTQVLHRYKSSSRSAPASASADNTCGTVMSSWPATRLPTNGASTETSPVSRNFLTAALYFPSNEALRGPTETGTYPVVVRSHIGMRCLDLIGTYLALPPLVRLLRKYLPTCLRVVRKPMCSARTAAVNDSPRRTLARTRLARLRACACRAVRGATRFLLARPMRRDCFPTFLLV